MTIQEVMVMIAGFGFSLTFLATVWKIAAVAGKLQTVVEHLTKVQEAQANALGQQADLLKAHAVALTELQVTLNLMRRERV